MVESKIMTNISLYDINGKAINLIKPAMGIKLFEKNNKILTRLIYHLLILIMDVLIELE